MPPFLRGCLLAVILSLGPTTLSSASESKKAPTAPSGSVGQWQRFEASFHHKKKYADPYADVRLEVTYTRPDGKKMTFWGFYDGDATWKIRWMPDAVGTWKYQARFSDGSAGMVGEFTCVASKSRGLVIADPDNPIWFRYASGEPTLLRSLHVGDRFFAANWPAE